MDLRGTGAHQGCRQAAPRHRLPRVQVHRAAALPHSPAAASPAANARPLNLPPACLDSTSAAAAAAHGRFGDAGEAGGQLLRNGRNAAVTAVAAATRGTNTATGGAGIPRSPEQGKHGVLFCRQEAILGELGRYGGAPSGARGGGGGVGGGGAESCPARNGGW